jgi:hypothetical protein
VTLHASLQSIQNDAFRNTGLTSIIIPSSVTSIGNQVFEDCLNLATVQINNQSNITSLGVQVFRNIPSTSTVRFYNTASAGDLTPIGEQIADYFNINNRFYEPPPPPSPTIIMGNKRVFKGDSITVNPISNNSTGTFTYQSNNGKVSIQGNIIRGLEIGTATITVTQQASGNYTTGTATFQVEVFYYYCFKEGTSILTEDGYVKVEELTQTHKVKTLNGYKKVYGLRKNEIEHKGLEERIADQLYVCRKEEYPELTEELVMTGRHGILENVFKDEKQIEDVKKVMGKLSSTGAKVRVPVCVDERSKVYEVQGKHSIYHVAVENDNRKINEGIYANGLLVESCSISEL